MHRFLTPDVARMEGALLRRAAAVSARATAMQPGPEADMLLVIAAEFTELAGEPPAVKALDVSPVELYAPPEVVACWMSMVTEVPVTENTWK